MSNYTYKLVAHSKDVVEQDWLGTVAKHSGYSLITYKDGVPISVSSIDLYRILPDNKIAFDIKEEQSAQVYYLPDKNGLLHKVIVGKYVNQDGNSNFEITEEWLKEYRYQQTEEPLLIDDDALKAFYKISLEASILNYFSDKLDYEVSGKNCNSSTKYFADKYLEGIDVFADLDGAFVGNNYDFTKDNIGAGPTNIDNEAIKKVSEVLDKFYSVLEESGYEFDYSNVDVYVEHKNDGFYLKITDGVKNYIFDDDYNSSITGSAIDDIVYLGNGRNVINSGAGNDTIYGGDGVDVVHGGADDDRIITGKGNDIIFGGTGINYIEPGEGNNEIHCDPNGEDHIYISNVAGGVDTIYGASISTVISFGGGFSRIEEVGKDLVFYGVLGNKVILKDVVPDRSGSEEGSGSTGSGSSGSGGNGMPSIYDDSGNKYLIGEGGQYSTIKENPPAYPGQGGEDTGGEGPDGPGGDGPGTGEPPVSDEPPVSEEPIKEIPPLVGDKPWYEIGIGIDCPGVIIDDEGNIVARKGEDGKYQTTLPEYNKDKEGGQCPIPGAKEKFKEAETITSPLVLDLDGDGVVETTNIGDGTYFDHDNNGFSEKTSWAGKDDGILVRDLNGNGEIDGGYELFGNNTVLSNGEKAANGFEALADLDSNSDGIFNANDETWNEVRVWQDKNSNGKIDAGEIMSLEEAGVEGINLGYETSNTVDENGNAHKQTGSFIDLDGNVKQINDVWFEVDGSDSKYELDIEIPDDIKALPNIQGFGNVYSLHEAMTLDESGALKALVELYVSTTDYTQRQNILTNIIYHWTGVQDIASDSRGTAMYGNSIGDARKLEALEEFLGEEYQGTWCSGIKDSNPHAPAAVVLLEAFEELKHFFQLQLFSEMYKDILTNISLIWNPDEQEWNIDASKAVEGLRELYNSNTVLAKSIISDLSDLFISYETLGTAITCAFKSEVANNGSPFSIDIYSLGNLKAIGTEENDNLYAETDNSFLIGRGGDDYIVAKNGDNIINAGKGNDTIYGGIENDTYIYNLGDGFDVINDTGGSDRIIFGAGIEYENLIFRKASQGYGLIILINGDETQGLKLEGFFYPWHDNSKIETLVFSDGSEVKLGEGRLILHQGDGNDSLYGTIYDDIIYGNGGNDSINGSDGDDYLDGGEGDDGLDGGWGDDILIGGIGDDILRGSAGNDTYIYNLGDGFDIIDDSEGYDKIIFGEDISLEDFSFTTDGYSLTMFIKGEKTQGIKISNFMRNNYSKVSLVFADGQEVNLKETGFTFNLEDRNDSLYGTIYDDIIYGNGGNDYINGSDGDDYLDGGEGDDSLEGGWGNDILVGGKGNDNLNGGEGNDTYIYNMGDGFDTIYDSGGNDKIVFGEGISFENLNISNDGRNTTISMIDDETQGMKICNTLYSNQKIETLEFADGSSYTWDGSNYQANQMIQAMASFGAANASIMDVSNIVENAVENVISAGYDLKQAA